MIETKISSKELKSVLRETTKGKIRDIYNADEGSLFQVALLLQERLGNSFTNNLEKKTTRKSTERSEYIQARVEDILIRHQDGLSKLTEPQKYEVKAALEEIVRGQFASRSALFSYLAKPEFGLIRIDSDDEIFHHVDSQGRINVDKVKQDYFALHQCELPETISNKLEALRNHRLSGYSGYVIRATKAEKQAKNRDNQETLLQKGIITLFPGEYKVLEEVSVEDDLDKRDYNGMTPEQINNIKTNLHINRGIIPDNMIDDLYPRIKSA